jgi:hypothetical protein
VRSASIGKIFPTEAEGNCGEAACFPAPVSRWNQQAEQKEMLPEQNQKTKMVGNVIQPRPNGTQ